ncbi:MAG: stage III sporulation protein AD [Clostridia bacterium]|nr:stage III sporulation protein AD [Clostridia bacterium]
MVIVILKQYRPEFVVYVSIISGIIIFFMIFDKFRDIINLLYNLSNKVGANSEFIVILIKITGIAILTEFAVSICKDCGESAIASKIDLGGKVLIIGASVPIVSALLETLIAILP